MISKTLAVIAVWLSIPALAAIAIFFHRANAHLRNRIADFPRTTMSGAEARADNTRLRDVVARVEKNNGEDGQKAVHEEVVRLRSEVTQREQQAELRHAQLFAQAEREATELANNRNPESGLTRLEYFQNIGRATPAAACQTLVWAALKGDDATLADVLFLPESTRAKARELIASLPDAERHWTPEKIAGLYFAAAVTDVSAAQIVNATLIDSQHAVVVLRIPGVAEAKSKLALQLGANGWQVAVDASSIDVMQRKISAASKK